MYTKLQSSTVLGTRPKVWFVFVFVHFSSKEYTVLYSIFLSRNCLVVFNVLLYLELAKMFVVGGGGGVSAYFSVKLRSS